jgi:uncharacterized membrane protein YvbJ
MLNFCPNCGTKIEEGWNACPYCGHNILSEQESQPLQQPTLHVSPNSQQSPQPTTIIYPPKENKTNGIVALIFAFLGLFLLPIIGSIIAIIFGSIGRNKDDSTEMATAGLVLGIVGLICWVIGIGSLVSFIMSMMSTYPY